jgi:hypothetical protein
LLKATRSEQTKIYISIPAADPAAEQPSQIT